MTSLSLRNLRVALARRTPRAIRSRLRPISLLVIAVLTMTQIIALRPSQVDEPEDQVTSVDPDTLVPENEVTLAEGIPQDKVPDYTVETFTHVSTQGAERQWKLVAEKAFLYNQDHLVHARRIQAFLYDPDGKTTVITGREAKYFMNQRDLEIYGDVKTVFPDGFEVDSQYLRHSPTRHRIDIPEKYAVRGNASHSGDHRVSFTSQGLHFDMAREEITLPSEARVMTLETPPQALASQGAVAPSAAAGTTIESDRCVIFRKRRFAQFRMSDSRPLKTRFVRITQPTMYARSRRADLNYGDFAEILHYLVLHDDVLVKETRALGLRPDARSQEPLRYATGGKAEFDAHKDLVVLTEFPQVYQDNDTVTGDVIKLYRDSDVVEVEHSNAFSQGND